MNGTESPWLCTNQAAILDPALVREFDAQLEPMAALDENSVRRRCSSQIELAQRAWRSDAAASPFVCTPPPTFFSLRRSARACAPRRRSASSRS